MPPDSLLYHLGTVGKNAVNRLFMSTERATGVSSQLSAS